MRRYRRWLRVAALTKTLPSMAIGRLHVDVPPPVFITTSTLLGTMYITAHRGKAIMRGEFEVRRTPELVGLDTPVKFYDVIDAGGEHTGYGFVGPVPAEVLTSGLIFRYSSRLITPELAFRSTEFCVYHATNSATVITRPVLAQPIADLLVAI